MCIRRCCGVGWLPVTEAERVIDPACAATIDLVNAPKATYQRKVYYFCSAADRDEFVKDPAAYLKKRGKGIVKAVLKAFLDRKSTRLNSSHSQISYAVFCLKKKIH